MKIEKIGAMFAFFKKFVPTRIAVIFVLAYLIQDCSIPTEQLWVRPIAYVILGLAYAGSIAVERLSSWKK